MGSRAGPLLAACLLAAAAASGQGAGEMSRADRSALADGLAAFDRGEAERAESALAGLVQRYPSRFEIVETLGLIYARRNDLTRAATFFEKACKANGASGPAWANLGAAYLGLGRNQEAVEALEKAAALDPQNGQTQSGLGQALMLAGRPQRAAQAFAAANDATPGDPDIVYNWGLALYESGDAGRAAAILERVPAASMSAQAHSLAGDAEERIGRFDLALAHKRDAARGEPSEGNLDALGIELLRHGNFDAAIEVYEYGLSRQASSARLRMGLGIARYGLNDFGGSARIFSGLLATYPDEARYASLLGGSCNAMKDDGDAGSACDDLLDYAERHPADAAGNTAAASLIVNRGQTAKFDGARRMLERAIAADPGSAEPWLELGILELERGNWRESLAALRKAAALRPASSKTHWRLAQTYSHLGEREKAHEELALHEQCHETEEAGQDAHQRSIQTFILNED